jgi:catechol 2,3-dioxygenase-like lactoylglutathione lyase family enzyme
MVRGVASVLVFVRDLESSADFYRRLLGVAPARTDGAVVEFEAGTLRLVLHRDRNPPRAGVRGAVEVDLEVADAAAFRDELGGRGIDAPAPRREPWGWTGFAVTDPDGNVIGCYEVKAAAR